MIKINPNHTSNETIAFDEESFQEFEKIFNKERIHGDTHVFYYQKHPILVAYAAYLIQYINNIIQNQNEQ